MKKRMASKADKYVLYQDSVQSPEYEVDFARTIFSDHNGREANVMREDFCGTALVCCEWARQGGYAIGVDLDTVPLTWGIENNLSSLSSKERKRVRLVKANVIDVEEGAEVVLATNFSHFIFRERNVMANYFENVYNTLSGDGVFISDIMGGPGCQVVARERTAINKKFDYIWEHKSFDPITQYCDCRIHFRFADGSKMKNAFVYPWRLWNIVELKELLKEAGFGKVDVFWENEKEEHEIMASVDECPHTWTAYIVAYKE